MKTVVLSSLHRVFPDSCPEGSAVNRFSALKNEPFSFQVAFRKKSGQGDMHINVRIDSDLDISFYYASFVPVIHTDLPGLETEARPGMYADVLVPKAVNPELVNDGFWCDNWFEVGEKKVLAAVSDAWQTLWLTVNEQGKRVKPGLHKIVITFLSGRDCSPVASEEITLELIDRALLPQKLYCTNWFYGDSICDAHGVEPMSDEFFTAVYNYAKKAAVNGQNMILTPCFTPPLDTPVGKERRTVQLVGIKATPGGRYEFDFSLLKRFVDTCKRAGIKHFEHNHLFTQWGAKAAPKIVAEVRGKTRRIFGWDTPSDSPEYRKFLKAYLPAVCGFFRSEGLEKNVLFHISDEPMAEMADTFRRAKEGVGDMLDGFMTGDALSHYELYEQGLVQTPIVSTYHIEDFAGRCKNFWCYYTGEQVKGKYSNRVPSVSPMRNRMLGVQMYTYRIKGFLHWGYNYYYDAMSHGYTDPRLNPGVYGLSSGTSYLVYPAEGLDCYQSVRQKIFAEGITDMRALETLEKLKGREFTEKLCEKHFGKITFDCAADTPEEYLAFREEVNRALAE